MINKILHTVTNRADFVSPIFDDNSDFTPVVDSGATLAVRKILRMTDISTDYYVLGILNAIDAFYDIKVIFGDDIQTYDLASYVRSEDSMSGGTLVSDENGPPRIARHAAELPVYSNLALTYQAANRALLASSDGTLRSVAGVREHAGKLFVEWPEEVGITGAIALADGNPWQSGCQVTIHHEPLRFPYEIMAQRLSNSRHNFQLLTASGVADAYYASHIPAEKVAISALSVAMQHPQFPA